MAASEMKQDALIFGKQNELPAGRGGGNYYASHPERSEGTSQVPRITLAK
jgi:hypothetical protein